MASSLACVLAAPPLRASSIAASHFAQLVDRRLDMAAEDAQHDLGVLVSLGDVAVVPGLREGGHGGLLLRLEPFGALLGGDVHSCPVLACRFAGVLSLSDRSGSGRVPSLGQRHQSGNAGSRRLGLSAPRRRWQQS